MKFKSLLLVVGFIPAMAQAQAPAIRSALSREATMPRPSAPINSGSPLPRIPQPPAGSTGGKGGLLIGNGGSGSEVSAKPPLLSQVQAQLMG